MGILKVRRLKVLISAYACEPNSSSEPGVGWNHAISVAKFHDVHVVTRKNNKPHIDRYLSNRSCEGLNFIYFDWPPWLMWWKKGKRGMRFYYYLWQIGIIFIAKRYHEKINFDICHHVTFVKYWVPTFLWALQIPFIWGPVGGGESAPRAFWWRLSLRGKFYEVVRSVLRTVSEFDPFLRLSARRSDLAFATTNQTAERLKKLGVKNTRVWEAVGLNRENFHFLAGIGSPSSEKFRFILVGNLIHLKGFDIAIRAFASAQLPNAELWVVGDGAERPRLTELVKEHRIEGEVKFWGKLSLDDTLTKLGECHAMVHPALHDSGGWACLEAMAAKKPVICIDLGGPAQIVSDNCGFIVSAKGPDFAIENMADAMRKLVDNPSLLKKLGLNGLRRVQNNYIFEEKAKEWSRVYIDLVDA